MATKWIATVMAALVSMLTSGCLVYERLDTFYLDPSGGVTWSVIEKDVRSDADSADDRQQEEADYIASVLAQNHGLARGFRLLSPTDVRTRVLRSALPYTVTTEARFSGLDVLGQRLIARLGLVGSSVMESTADGTQWTFTVRPAPSPDAAATEDDDLHALTRGLDRVSVALTRGRFVAAQGFELSPDGRLARFVEDPNTEAKLTAGADVVLALRWK